MTSTQQTITDEETPPPPRRTFLRRGADNELTRHQRVLMRVVQVGVLVVALVTWELISGPVVSPLFISSPTDVAATFWMWIVDGTFAYHGVASLRAAMIGYVIGLSTGLLVGYALGVSTFWSRVFEPYVSAFWGLPRITLIPLLLLWVGIGETLATTIAALMSFFPVFFNTYYGVRDVRTGLINAVRIMGGSRWTIATKVRLPSAFVWVVAAMKLSIPQSLVAVVVAEMLASNRGLGHLVSFNAGQFNTRGTIAAMIALMIVGFTLTRIVTRGSDHILRWKVAASPLS